MTLPEASPFVVRHAGADRVATAVQIAGLAGGDGATAVIATAGDYPDALAAVPLARHLGAPLLLSARGGLSPATADELTRRGTSEVVLVGGTAALSTQVEADLDALGIAWERIAGGSRFETAGLIADRLPATGRVTVVEGEHPDPGRGWPDALTAGVFDDPILLVTSGRLPDETGARLSGDLDVRVVGGPAAVGEGVVAELDALAASVTRLAGANRYATSRAGAEAALAEGADLSTVWLATGRDWPDGLVAGAADGLVLLIDGQDPGGSPATSAWLAEQRAAIELVRLAGGTAAISDTVEAAVRASLTGPSGR